MGRFFDHQKLTVDYIDGRDWTLENREYGWGYETSAGEWIIPVHLFGHDFGSIPRIAWALIGPPSGWGKGMNYVPACIIHDFLYEFGYVFKPGIGNISIDRKRADLILLEAMESLFIPKWRREIMYFSVRVGGSYYWNKHRKNEPLTINEQTR